MAELDLFISTLILGETINWSLLEEKKTIWNILNVEKNIGVSLTESLAMWPASSVSGYYFANPSAKYFGLGKISKDQVEDYANRKKITLENAIKWLKPNLNF